MHSTAAHCPCNAPVGNLFEDAWDGAKSVAKKAGRVVDKAARAVLPDAVVEVFENAADEVFDLAGDRIVKELRDPYTWALVGAAVVSVASLGTAAPVAAAVAAEAIAAKVAAGMTGEAFQRLSTKGKDELVKQAKKAGGKLFEKSVDRAAKLIESDPRFKDGFAAARRGVAVEKAKKAVALLNLDPEAKGLRAEAVDAYADQLVKGKSEVDAKRAARLRVSAVKVETENAARQQAGALSTPEAQAAFVLAYQRAVQIRGESPADAAKSARRAAGFVTSDMKARPEFQQELARWQRGGQPGPAVPAPIAPAPVAPVVRDEAPVEAPAPAAKKGPSTALIVGGLAAAAVVAYVVLK